MISLEQIRELESKITKAVNLISVLREENHTLKNTLEKSQKRIEEFDKLVSSFKNDQKEIEDTILSALKTLDTLEDEVSSQQDSSADTPVEKSNQAKLSDQETPENRSGEQPQRLEKNQPEQSSPSGPPNTEQAEAAGASSETSDLQADLAEDRELDIF